MNRTTREDYLAALADADQDDEDLNADGPELDGLEEGEAERLAAAAEAPRQRADGNVVGAEGWKRQRPLTEKQRAFVQGVIEGKSYRQAYRDAYPDAQGQDQSIASSAFRLSRDPRVQALIRASEEEQQEHLAEDLAATRRYVMRKLLALSKDGAESTKIRSLELLGKAAGMWRETMQQQAQPLTAAELKAALAGHLRLVTSTRGKARADDEAAA